MDALRTSWLFPAIEAIHLIAIALLVGSIFVVDISLLRRQPVEALAAKLKFWTSRGLEVVVLTGLLMFFSDMQRYLHNPAFRWKLRALADCWSRCSLRSNSSHEM